MLRPFVLLLLMGAGMSQAGWVPPKDLDIHEIISAARDDRKSKNYIEALEKLIWIHEESLKYRPSFYGVRLSYAIAEWVRLSEIYEPAKQALLEASDKNRNKIKGGDDCCREALHDFVSINSELGRHERIVELFKWADKNKPTAAKDYFSLAMPTLVQAKEFSLCGKYIEPKKKVEQLKELYAINLELAKDPEFGDGMQEYTEKSFVNGITMLVAILVQNNRHEEASTISDKSIEVLDTEKFKSKLSKVMAGDMPAPWP